MKKWAYIFCMALLWASCSSIFSSKPVGTLSESQMVDLLVDIHLTEATLKMANDSISRLDDTTGIRQRFAQVFKKYEINPDNFNNSLNYYIEHIDDLNKIYAEVIVKLTELDARLTAKSTAPPEGGNSVAGRHSKANMANPWYRTLNKNQKPIEFQYFDSNKYPFTANRSPAR